MQPFRKTEGLPKFEIIICFDNFGFLVWTPDAVIQFVKKVNFS